MKSRSNKQQRRVALKNRRKRRRRIQRSDEEALLQPERSRKPDQLPTGSASRALRQAALIETQRKHGNAFAQRLLDKATDRQVQRATAQVSVTPTAGTTPAVQRGLWGWIKKTAKKAWSGIKKGASKVWGGIKKGVSKVWGGIKKGAKGLWKGLKKAWKAIKKGAKAVWTGLKWVGKQLWSKLKGIFYRVIGWIKKLPGRLKRLFSTLWKGVKSLKPWSLKWWKSLGKASTWKGFLKWLGTAGIQLLEVMGIGELYETVTDFLKFNTRPLTGTEIAKAKVVFHDSIDYNLVRVDQYALLGPSWTKREYVSFNTINAWGPMDDHTLIHELTHVWQYTKMGAIYMPKAIHAQKTGGYNYGGIKELRKRQAAGQSIHSFNLEQQGQITGDYYVGKTNGTLTGADLATYEHFIKDVRH